MQNYLKFLMLFFSLGGHAWAGPIWIQTWSDEFNAAANTSVDPAKWSFDIGGGGYGNGELETYTSRLQNVRQDGAGHLIVARSDPALRIRHDGSANANVTRNTSATRTPIAGPRT